MFQIDVTDLYPKGICNDCIQLIEYVVEIRNTFQKTQQNLQQRFQDNKYEKLEVQSSEVSSQLHIYLVLVPQFEDHC